MKILIAEATRISMYFRVQNAVMWPKFSMRYGMRPRPSECPGPMSLLRTVFISGFAISMLLPDSVLPSFLFGWLWAILSGLLSRSEILKLCWCYSFSINSFHVSTDHDNTVFRYETSTWNRRCIRYESMKKYQVEEQCNVL